MTIRVRGCEISEVKVQVVDEDSGKTKAFSVNIKWAADVDVRALLNFVL